MAAVNPAVPKAMASGPSAVLATWFQLKGVNYSISSACATSAHCIGAAAEQIAWGKQDVVFAGGCEDIDWSMSNMFDAMGAMSSNFNDTPSVASRAYDAARDGFVIAGGAGIVVLEEYERAKASAKRTFGLLDTAPAIVDPPAPRRLGRARGEVEFDGVGFTYQRGGPVLAGTSFRVAAGETVGIAGPTGAGKTTLIKVLLRLYDVTAGAVRLDLVRFVLDAHVEFAIRA